MTFKVLTKNMKCVIYLRVSTDEQVNNFSLGTQLKACQDYAKKQGYEIVKIFRDEGESAKTADRPQLLELLSFASKNKHNVGSVIVYCFNRLARNTLDHLGIKAKLSGYGIRLESATEPIDDSPSGRFQETVLSAVAQLDNEVRADRARGGLKARFFAGLASTLGLGYKMVEANGKKIPNVGEFFEETKDSWLLMATGTKSLTEMAVVMNEKGIKIKWGKKYKSVTKQYLSKLFRNKFYSGWLVSKEHPEWGEIKGVHTPMITEQVFYRVQDILDGRNRNSEVTKRNVKNEAFPLRGILKCNICGSPFRSGNCKGNGGIYPKYWCSDGCVKSIAVKNLNKLLRKKLAKVQATPDLINGFTFLLEVKYNRRLNKLIQFKKGTDKRLLDAKEMMTLLVRGNMEGKYPDDIFEQEKDRLQNVILTLQSASNDNLIEQYNIKTTTEFIKALFKNLFRAYELSDYGQKRVLLGSIYPSGLTFDGISLLNHDMGPGFEAIQVYKKAYSNPHVNFSAGDRT